MFEFEYNNVRIRLRVLTILIWGVLAVAAIFGAYPFTVLNVIALLDFMLIVSSETVVAIKQSRGRFRKFFFIGLVLTILAIAASYVLWGARYFWIFVLSIRSVVKIIARFLQRPRASKLDKLIKAAATYNDDDLGWLESVLVEARKQIRWRALVALYGIDRRTLEGVAADIIKKSPERSKKASLAACVISSPLLFASYVEITTKPLTGTLEDWLSAVWKSLRHGLSGIPIRAVNDSHSLPLSRLYMQDLPDEIHGALLGDEATDRRSPPPDLDGLRQRADRQDKRYGTAGPWTLYQVGLAEAQRDTDRGVSNQSFLAATLFAEGLLAGSIKVLSKLSPLPGMNPEFAGMPAINPLEPEDKLALMQVCADCRLRLAESFYQSGLVDEARRNVMDALDCLRTAPPGETAFLDPYIERMLLCLLSIRAWTMHWRGLDFLLPATDEQSSAAEVITETAARALDRLSVGDRDAAREAVHECCEMLESTQHVEDVQWEYVYAAANAALQSGAFNGSTYLLQRWQNAAKTDDWNNREREVHAVNQKLLIDSLDESENLVPHAATLLTTMFDVTADAARTLTQGELLDFLERSYLIVSSALTVLLNWPDEPPEEKLVEPAILILASLRSTSLNALRYRRQIIRTVDDDNLTRLFRARGALASDLASYDFQSRLQDVKDRGERLMTDRRAVFDLMLARYFAQYEAAALRHTPSAAEVQAALGDDEVFVFFFRYGNVDLYAASGFSVEYYGAAIFRRESPMQLARLGEAAAIDHAVDRLVGHVYDGETTWQRQADTLSDLLAPLLEQLTDTANWVICPAHNLYKAPFCLLKVNGRRANESVCIRYVSTLFELVSPAPDSVESNPPLVLGNPDFDHYDPDEATVSLMSEYTSVEMHDSRTRGETKPQHPHFEPLQQTEQEAQEVAALLGVDAHTGKDARESLVKSVAAPRILHLATHGYWIRSADDDNLDYHDELKSRFERSGHTHPLSRSGIALAGANWFVDDRTIADQGDDGLLNGYDVLELELTGTELVVLSACRTGESDSLGIAGALGLRFAFAAAGARSQLTTLWPVGDRVTRLFMSAFYDGLVNQKMSRPRALQAAQQVIRRKPEYEHPFYWSAFVLYGDDAPLF